MRDAKRNCIQFYAANFLRKEDILNEDGFKTGQTLAVYSEPVQMSAHISTARGNANNEIFGVDTQYDRVISTTKDLGLTETSIIWVDAPVSANADYKVEKVAKGLHQNFYAIKGVTL